jgi:hypothetical protein
MGRRRLVRDFLAVRGACRPALALGCGAERLGGVTALVFGDDHVWIAKANVRDW